MIGQERTVLPLLAKNVFGLTAYTSALTFIVAFGAVKAATNFFAGTLSDRIGRKPVLVAGWLIGVPVPLLLMWAPSWGWVIFANVLLGVNQGLTWSTTVIMKIDLAGPARRDLRWASTKQPATEVALNSTGFIAAEYGLRPEPFFLGRAHAALGLGLSTFFVRERGHAHQEARDRAGHTHLHDGLDAGSVCASRPSKSVRCRHAAKPAGEQPQRRLGVGHLPALLRAGRGSVCGTDRCWPPSTPRSGASGSSSPAHCRIAPGARPIAAGMWVQAAAIGLIARRAGSRRALRAVLLGVHRDGVPDAARSGERRRAPRLAPPPSACTAATRAAVGALLAGFVADAFGLEAAIWSVAAMTAASGLVVASRMYETHHVPLDHTLERQLIRKG